MPIADRVFQERSEDSLDEAGSRVTSIFHRNQDLLRARIVAARGQHLGHLPIRLLMELRLQREPFQARLRIGGRLAEEPATAAEVGIGKSVNHQIAGLWPASFVVVETLGSHVSQVQSRVILEDVICPNQASNRGSESIQPVALATRAFETHPVEYKNSGAKSRCIKVDQAVHYRSGERGKL